ncbi:MAG: hypothetical protein IPM26_06800 [Saprospiraceae bacterium]|nr:hypothetical protein [Saprospiraceae bacterium]
MPKFFIFGLIIFISSCYNRREACLDPFASNFDVTADDPCEQCCKDPLINVTIRHLAGDSLISPSRVLINELGQSYRILNFSYYLSGFRIIKNDGSIVTVSQLLNLDSMNTVLQIPDDFAIYRLTNVNQTIGQNRNFGTYTGFEFTLGLDSKVLLHQPKDLPLLHVLNDSLSLKTPDRRLAHQIITVATGDSPSEIQSYFISGINSAVSFKMDSTFRNVRGTDINLIIKADYSKWFENVDFTRQPSEIEKSILENSKKLFSVN